MARTMPPASPDTGPEHFADAATGASEGDIAHLERAAVQRFRANQANVDRSAIGAASIGRATLRQSAAGIVVGRSVAADQVRVGILVSPVVRGEVHTWLDMRSAIAIGLGMALGRALLAVVRAGVRKLG
jgi:hypothetical protein